MIKGFKILNEDFTNRYGFKFELEKIYTIEGKVTWGTRGNGFHFCKNLEDTFRYFDAINFKVQIADVSGAGDIITVNDEYYGYYDMYACSNIKINNFLKREEIINYLYKLLEYDIINRDRIIRFLSGYKLNDYEINKVLSLIKIKDKYNFDTYEKIIKFYQK